MLPRAEAPARRLPYTTADMSERLAKRKAEQDAAAQAQANQALRFGVTNPPAVKKDEPWYKDALGAVGGAIKYVYNNAPSSNPISTPINMGGDAGVSMGGQGTGKSLVTEPARLAVRRAVGDITAIPRVGEPSPSYTADQIREQGVARGLLGAAIDYSQFIPVVAKGAGVTGDLLNAYKIARIERAANPFPALRYADDVIDVAEGSRLPASTQRALPPAEIAPAIAETPASRLTPPAVRERAVPASSRLTSEIQPNGNNSYVIIRSFNQQTGEFTGVIQLYYSAYDGTAKVVAMAATSPTVTPQLIAAAKMEIMKLGSTAQFPIDPSNSLSAYSRPFVERLQQAGLIDPSYELPEVNMLNPINKDVRPGTFASPFAGNQTVIDPLSYQPTYNDILKALAESRRQAKLAGETGRLSTSSKRLETLKFQPPGLNDAAAYRVNMRHLRIPEHPLLKQMSDDQLNSFMREIYTNPRSAAYELVDMWKKIEQSEGLGIWAESYANTPENLKKFPDILKDAYLINQASRNRLMSELETILLKLPEDEIFS